MEIVSYQNYYDLYKDRENRNIKIVLFSIICIFVISFFTSNHITINKMKKNVNNNNQYSKNELIKENFFIFDSNNLENINPHMYGYSITRDGILTDNYYKGKGNYIVPDPQGVYIMIRKEGDEIKINQDFQGNFGIYLYENQNKDYFALSNSFILLEEYLVDKQNISLNKDFTNNFVISPLCSPSIYETMIQEITKIPSNSYLIINIPNKTIKINSINYEENTIPIESEEGLKIIDKWIDKWGYIIRSLLKKTRNISLDLSGGFDTRTLLTIFFNSGIDINKILINSSHDKKHCHEEDYKIASNITNKFGLKLNNHIIDNYGIEWDIKDTLYCTMYSKLGFHKEFYLKKKFFEKPIFKFHGGGEIRGYPSLPIKEYIEDISSKWRNLGEQFYLSSKRICNRSVAFLKKEKKFDNDYEISSTFYQKGRSSIHDGKTALEGFLANIYFLQPLIDADIKKIKFDLNKNSTYDLVAYIYVRFKHELINFPFQGNRTLSLESIKKAERLNKLFKPYIIKYNYNKNFFIDVKRKSPVSLSNTNKNINLYFQELFGSTRFIETLKKLYNISVYNSATNYSKKNNYFPLRYFYGLFSIVKTIDFLDLNKKYMNKLNYQK